MTDEDIVDKKNLMAAQTAYNELMSGDFIKWAKATNLNDLFNQELYDRYNGEHIIELKKHSIAFLKSVMRCAKRYNVRFMSIWRDDMFVLEDIRYPIDLTKGLKGKPVSWFISDILDITWGSGDIHCQQIKAPCLQREHWGLYDIRDNYPIIIANPLSRVRYGNKNFTKVFYEENMTLSEYLESMAIDPIDPIKCDWTLD